MTINANKMADALKSWYRNTFGNIHARKIKILARLGGFQKTLAEHWHNGLVKLNKKLRLDLEEVLRQEELMWYQQSRENWIKSGDRNTKYYHLSTMVRKKHKRGHILKDASGKVAGDLEESGKFLQEYFQSIFSPPAVVETSPTLGGGFPILDSTYWLELNYTVSQEEVRKALFSMAPYKASGPDGFPVVFYQKTWEIVGASICSLVTTYFEAGTLPEGINDTLVSLSPKIAHPDNVTQFRPISLCNVSYKIITKVMVNRLKPIFERLVSQEQSSFVPSRQITDNIVIYQEVLHSLRVNKTSKKFMVIKVDLEKAYDRLRWD